MSGYMARKKSNPESPDKPKLGQRARKVLQRKEHILTVSARLFRERGFHAVSIDEVGTAAGMSGPAMYKYFSDKGSILAALLDRGTGIAKAAFEAIDREGLSDIDLLNERVRVCIEFTGEVRDALVVAVREANSIPEWYRDDFLREQRLIREVHVDILMRIRPELSKADARYICSNVFQGLISSSVYLYPADTPARKKRLAQMAMAALFA